jgi:hypothetical protein
LRAKRTMQTRQIPIPTWLRRAGSLSTLGSLGGALGYLAYSGYPALKDGGLSPHHAAAIGGAIGSAVHFICLPILRYIFDYVRLGELLVLKWIGALPADEADRLRSDIIHRHFQPADSRGDEVRARSEDTAQHTTRRKPTESDTVVRPSSLAPPLAGSRVLARRAVKRAPSNTRSPRTPPKRQAQGQKRRAPR